GSNGRRPPSCDYVEEFFPPLSSRLTRWDVNSGNASKTWTLVHAVTAKDHFLFGSFRNGYKEWVFPLVKGYWDRSLQPSLAWKVAREKKTILLSSFFNLPESSGFHSFYSKLLCAYLELFTVKVKAYALQAYIGYKIEKNALDGCPGIEKEGRLKRRKAVGRYRSDPWISDRETVSFDLLDWMMENQQATVKLTLFSARKGFIDVEVSLEAVACWFFPSSNPQQPNETWRKRSEHFAEERSLCLFFFKPPIRSRSPLLTGSRLISLPLATKMFQFAKFEKSKEQIKATELGYGFPIGDPWITDGHEPDELTNSSTPLLPFFELRKTKFRAAFWRSPYGSQSSFAEMPFKKIFSRIGTRPTILDLANSGADGDSPIDSTDSIDASAHKHMDRMPIQMRLGVARLVIHKPSPINTRVSSSTYGNATSRNAASGCLDMLREKLDIFLWLDPSLENSKGERIPST
ncbi:hypothetical protein HAX54_047750, partial [Datura stramonium]|nr:hypothetical protein [Datura stramonium]